VKNSYGIYKVTGRRAYRNHHPGSTFTARLLPDVEYRALLRGDITLIRRVDGALQRGSYELPKDWPPAEVNAKQTPTGVLT
jgi:hypothetical protein